MPPRSIRGAVPLLVLLGCLTLVSGCGDDNGGEGPPPGARTSTIQGRVAQVVAALPPPPSRWAQWEQWLPGLRTAHAQGPGGVAGITVSAQQNGRAVDTRLTDTRGNFTLRVFPGPVTVRFTTRDFTVTVAITAPEDTTLHVVVTLRRTQVIIEELGVEQPPIRCTSGTQPLTEAEAAILIDGGGGAACIRTEGNCRLTMRAPDILLTNCERCVQAAGNARVTLDASGSIRCEALVDGVRAAGTAEVQLRAQDDIVIDGTERGIRASGSATVTVEAPDCTIHGTEEAIRTDGAARVEAPTCRLLEE